MFQFIIRKIKSRLFFNRYETRFIDTVSGKEVYRIIDCYGDVFLTDGMFGTRMKI